MSSTCMSASGARGIANPLAVVGILRMKYCGADEKSKPQRRVMRQGSGVDHRWP